MKDKKKYFSESAFWKFVVSEINKYSTQLLYSGLLLFYAYKRKDTPSWAKSIVIGSLGYLLAPIDALPDLTPFIGFTDDFGVLSFALVTISCYINVDVKQSAICKLEKIVANPDPEAIAEVEKIF